MHALALTVALLLAPQAPASSDALRSGVEAIVREALEQPGAVGLSVAVGLAGELILAEGYGLAEVEHGVPADAETIFRIGSVTKQFTAAAVMRAVERGEIELAADMRAYLPDYPSGERSVTMEHLLTHTSGIPSYTDLGPDWFRITPLELTHAEMRNLFEDRPFQFEPGEKWAYNNSGYYLLGVILEEVSGKPYGELLAAELFEPLGLARTRIGSNADVIPNRAQGYRFEDGELSNDRPIGMSQPGAAGALLSTAGDLVCWQVALVSGGAVEASSYEMMITPMVLPDGSSTGYGYGLTIGETNGRARVSHGGGIFGFNSYLCYYPEERLHVAVISNSEALPAQRVSGRVERVGLGLE